MKYKNGQGIVMYFYRIERWFYIKKCYLIAQFVYHFIQIVFGCTIPYSAQLDNNVRIAHFHGIVIHQNSKIGENTIIFQNVSLGGRNGQKGPIIGKNCVIGAGSCILGDIIIGDNVKIGANSVVLKNVDSNCTVVGIPAKVVKKSNTL